MKLLIGSKKRLLLSLDLTNTFLHACQNNILHACQNKISLLNIFIFPLYNLCDLRKRFKFNFDKQETCPVAMTNDFFSICLANLPAISVQDITSPIADFSVEEGKKRGENILRSNKLSFEDYLKLWKGIATSNPSASPLNALGEHLKTDHKLQNAHFELSRAEVEQEIRVQLAEHRKLMYGTFGEKDEKYADSVGSPTPTTASSGVRMLRHVYVGKPSKLSLQYIETSDKVDNGKYCRSCAKMACFVTEIDIVSHKLCSS